jgi:hypothetical protein
LTVVSSDNLATATAAAVVADVILLSSVNDSAVAIVVLELLLIASSDDLLGVTGCECVGTVHAEVILVAVASSYTFCLLADGLLTDSVVATDSTVEVTASGTSANVVEGTAEATGDDDDVAITESAAG